MGAGLSDEWKSKLDEKVEEEYMPGDTPILRWDGAAGSSKVWDSLERVSVWGS